DRPGNLSGASDQEVVAWAKRGHDPAFRELVRRYERPVFSLLYRMVRDRTLAEDLAQETFIKVLNAIGTYNPQHKFSSWIFKIANNAAIAHLRTALSRRIAIGRATNCGVTCRTGKSETGVPARA